MNIYHTRIRHPASRALCHRRDEREGAPLGIFHSGRVGRGVTAALKRAASRREGIAALGVRHRP